MSVTHDSGIDTSPACFAAKVRTLRTMLYEDAPPPMPQAVAATFVGQHEDGDVAHDAQPTAPAHGGFVLANARDDLVAIARDLGVASGANGADGKNAVTDNDPRVTVRLRSLLDNISVTLQGRQLPVLEQETIENSDGTNITTLASLCRHADDLIAGIKGGARDGGGGVCVVQ